VPECWPSSRVFSAPPAPSRYFFARTGVPACAITFRPAVWNGLMLFLLTPRHHRHSTTRPCRPLTSYDFHAGLGRYGLAAAGAAYTC